MPTLGIPINIPVAVRTGGDYGLRFSVSGISQVTPLAGADLTFWGYPALLDPRRPALPEGHARLAAGLPGSLRHQLPHRADPGGHHRPSPGRRPQRLRRLNCRSASRSRPTRTRATSRAKRRTIPATTDCRNPSFKPVVQVKPTTDRNRRALRPRPRTARRAKNSKRRSAVADPQRDRRSSRTASRSTPTPPTARPPVTTTRPTSAPSCRPPARTARRSAPSASAPRRSTARLPGSIYIGDPKPGDQYRLILAADGFGVHVKLTGSIKPDPVDRLLTTELVDLPAGSRSKDLNLHLFASDRGLLATPTQCSVHTSLAKFIAWNDLLPEQRTEVGFGLSSGPGRHALPGAAAARSTRTSSPAPRTRSPAPTRTSTCGSTATTATSTSATSTSRCRPASPAT